MKIELGLGHSLSGTGIQWRGAANPHIAVYGQSGSGKSYFLKKLLGQAAQQGVLCLIFDYTGDFRNYVPPDGLPLYRLDVLSPKFSLNPLVSTGSQDADLCAQQLLCAIHGIFRIGPRASLKLRQVTQRYLALEAGLPTLNNLLQYAQNQEEVTAGLLSALEPLELLATVVHCGDQSIGLDLTSPGLIILDFTRIFDQQVCRLLIELILQAIWTQRTHSTEECPIVLLLDECQNLAWGPNSIAVRILREGRKYDIAGWFASQWIENKVAAEALGQAALQVNFRPDDRNVRRLAKLLCLSESKELGRYERLVSSLTTGQFLFQRQDGRVLRVCVS